MVYRQSFYTEVKPKLRVSSCIIDSSLKLFTTSELIVLHLSMLIGLYRDLGALSCPTATIKLGDQSGFARSTDRNPHLLRSLINTYDQGFQLNQFFYGSSGNGKRGRFVITY